MSVFRINVNLIMCVTSDEFLLMKHVCPAKWEQFFVVEYLNLSFHYHYHLQSSFYLIQGPSVVCDKSQQVHQMETSDTSASERISPEKDELMYKIDDVPPW